MAVVTDPAPNAPSQLIIVDQGQLVVASKILRAIRDPEALDGKPG
jgi:hypothetical protein